MLVVALIFTLSTVTAVAAPGEPMKKGQVPLGKWWRHPSTVKNLNLTQKEMDSLDAAFDARARKFIELKHAIELAQFDMDQMMLDEPLDESALMAQFNKLETVRSNLSKERFQYYVQVRKLLGPERFQKIKTFRKRMHKQDKKMRKQKKKMQQ
jgi:Spy/CpxP family protein refolding chaperone